MKKKRLLRPLCLKMCRQQIWILTQLIFIFFFVASVPANAHAQQKNVSLKLRNATFDEFITELKKQTGLQFLYNSEEFKDIKPVNIEVTNEAVDKVLKQVLAANGLGYEYVDDVVVMISKPKAKEKPKPKPQQAQPDRIEIKGKVVDEKGNPLPGVTVLIQGSLKGTATDKNGKYSIMVKPSDALTFSYIGMKTKIELVKGKTKIDIRLMPEVEGLEEVSVVAFGEQKKESVVSAITTVKGEALKSSNSDLTTSLAGNVAGLIGWQTGGKPGALTEDEMNTKFYIRGITTYTGNSAPLILLDGVEISSVDLARINPDDIESLNVMKDAVATAMYGARGANGVVYVKTKKGKAGDVYISLNYERIYSMPTQKLEVVGPREFMKLYNKTILQRYPGSTPKYSRERIENTLNPKYPYFVYPGNDWFKKLFKDHSVNNHYSLNARGGGEKVIYYVSLSHINDKGMLKTDPLNQFDVNITHKMTAMMANLNINLTKHTKLLLNTRVNYDKYHGTLLDVRKAYQLAFYANPVDFAAVYPKDDYYTWPHIRFGGGRGIINPYAEMQKGYTDRVRFTSINQAELIKKLPGIWKGLELRLIASFRKLGLTGNKYETTPSFYQLAKYDFVTGKHKLKQTFNGRRTIGLMANEGASMVQRGYQAKLMHNAAWADHQTSFMAVFMTTEIETNTTRSYMNSLPARELAYAFRASYGYKERYFLEGNCGINGSERFDKSNKFGIFPAVGVAWIASKENFLRSANWLNFLKLRLGYGIVGNAGVIEEPRFLYLQEVDMQYVSKNTGRYPENRNEMPVHLVTYANKKTEWETSETLNLGAELKLFNSLDITVDLYQEIRRNIYDYRVSVPASMGLYRPPLDNVASVRARGGEAGVGFRHAFASDFWVSLVGMFTYAKATILDVEESPNTPPWQKKVGHELSQGLHYIADGLFQSQEEIDNSPFQGGKVQPGDIRYRDIDGNGTISSKDMVRVGYPETPRITYGLNGFVHYRGFELKMAFVGLGNRSFFLNAGAISPLVHNRAVLKAIADDHWSPGNQKNMPFWPGLSDKNVTELNPQEEHSELGGGSTYFMKNAWFVRCRQIELAAYLKKSWMKKMKIENCRIYFRATNPFILSGFKTWDVELGTNGFNYPIQKSYSLGLNLAF